MIPKRRLASFIHAGENGRTVAIKGDIAIYVLAMYSASDKIYHSSISTIQRGKRRKRRRTSPSAVQVFLNKPENRRIWVRARHGKKPTIENLSTPR